MISIIKINDFVHYNMKINDYNIEIIEIIIFRVKNHRFSDPPKIGKVQKYGI